jgi:cob(I)alamin adenosyltransferase
MTSERKAMKIYTKTGDAGETGLFGGARVSKGSARVDVYGEVDELNSVLGVARAHGYDPRVDGILHEVQSELFTLGAELATDPSKRVDVGVSLLGDAQIEFLERSIDALERDLSPLKTFILPGGCAEAAFLHLARTTCRRAERKLVALARKEEIRAELIRFLNRLSDLLFVTARHANFRANVLDVPWLGRNG